MGVCRSYSETQALRTRGSAAGGTILSVRVADRPERAQEIRDALIGLGCRVEARPTAAGRGDDASCAENVVLLVYAGSAAELGAAEARLKAIRGIEVRKAASSGSPPPPAKYEG